MSDPLVLYEYYAPAVVLKLNRPDKRNALSRDLIAALTAAFREAAADTSARCVILTGAGQAFCAGMDLTELQDSLTRGATENEVWNDALHLSQLYELIYTLPKPTIAAVNGPAVAGGAGLTTVCDLAIASDGAKFGYPEVRRGLVAALVMPHLLRHVGERCARYLLLTGELISAEEAYHVGLVNATTSLGGLLPRALAWAKQLAEGGPQALAATKELLRRFSPQAVSVEEAGHASAAPRLGEECRQGLEAFFARRPAPWAS
jgi:methylglutaconyl-CoA hydratase